MDGKESLEASNAGHLETGDASRGNSVDRHWVDHRENDDRAEVAKGKYAEAYNKRYWLSVNYIGTLFAIGVAFMGGIG